MWQFSTQPISIIRTILNSGSKGLSKLNVSAGSVKIQLTLVEKELEKNLFFFFLQIQRQLDVMIVRIDDELGRQHILDCVLLPLLKAKLATMEKDSEIFVWVMRSLVNLQRFQENLNLQRNHLEIVEKLVTFQTNHFQSEAGFAAYRCLTALAKSDCVSLKVIFRVYLKNRFACTDYRVWPEFKNQLIYGIPKLVFLI